MARGPLQRRVGVHDARRCEAAFVEEARQRWPVELQDAIDVGTSNDQSRIVDSMVKQLESSVMTAVALLEKRLEYLRSDGESWFDA